MGVGGWGVVSAVHTGCPTADGGGGGGGAWEREGGV